MENEINEFLEAYLAYQQLKGKHGGNGAMLTRAVASNNTAQLMHGSTGLFSTQGLNPEVFSTIYQPHGLGASLPRVGTRYTNPQFPALTGQEASNGSEPDDACGDPVRAGAKKACILTAQFGMLQRGTETIDPSEIITLLNRGEFTDLRLLGALLNNDTGFAPSGLADPDRVLNNVIFAQMNGVGIEYARVLSRQLWQGVTAGGTNGFQEFPGLDVQIATGQVDAVTGTTCPALDSDVKDFGLDLVGGSGRDVVEYMSMLEFFITNLAERTGITAEWVWVMRPELWQELTAVWPLAYNTNRGASVLAGNTRMIVNGTEMISARDQMRRSLTIEVNARTYRVILDTGINELTNITTEGLAAGQYASSIYFVPLRANGIPITRMEYLDYRVIGQMLGQTGELAGKVMFWSPDGMFLWVYRDLPGFCFDLVARTQQRVVLQTPHLAGRIDQVGYAPLQHIREPYPDSPYFADGGVSTRAAPSTNAVWL